MVQDCTILVPCATHDRGLRRLRPEPGRSAPAAPRRAVHRPATAVLPRRSGKRRKSTKQRYRPLRARGCQTSREWSSFSKVFEDMIEIQKEGENSYKFVIRSNHGQPLMESVSFPDSKEVHQALETIKPLVRQPATFERQTDHEGRFRFALKDPSGKVLGRSNAYGSEAGMENGIINTRNSILSGDLER